MTILWTRKTPKFRYTTNFILSNAHVETAINSNSLVSLVFIWTLTLNHLPLTAVGSIPDRYICYSFTWVSDPSILRNVIGSIQMLTRAWSHKKTFYSVAVTLTKNNMPLNVNVKNIEIHQFFFYFILGTCMSSRYLECA